MTARPGIGVPAKAFLEFEDNTKLACHFNPEELSWTKTVTWEAGEAKAGSTAPNLVYMKGESAQITLSLWFDTTTMASGGVPVSKYTNVLLDKLKPDKKFVKKKPKESTNPKTETTPTSKGRPPTVKFHWGNIHSFTAVITSVTIKYVFFSQTGIPLRAKVDVTLKQYEPDDDWFKQNPTSGTPNPEQLHTVQPGETLDRIAAVEFGDASKWRVIARANGIIDPLALRPGTVLTIPELEGAQDE